MLRNRTLNAHFQEYPEMRNPSGPLHSSMQISANSHGNHYRGLSLGRCIMQTTELSRQPPKQPGLSGQVDVKQFTSEITKNLLKQPQAAVEILSPQFWNHKCWFRLKWQTCKLPPCCRAAGTPPTPPDPPSTPGLHPRLSSPAHPSVSHCSCSSRPWKPFTSSSFFQISGQGSFF